MKKKISILSTKPLSEATLRKAEKAGLSIVSKSFIKIYPLLTETVKEKIKRCSHESLTVVFTSAHAVTAVFSAVRLQPDWKVFCISGKTKNTVLKFIREDNICGAAAHSHDLATIILAAGNIKRVVFFCGNKRRDTLPALLREQGCDVNEIVVYETVLSPEKVSHHYNGILFFSPSAVESFFLQNKIDNKTVLFSIGPTTTAALEKFSAGNKMITAGFPDEKHLLQEVEQFNFENT